MQRTINEIIKDINNTSAKDDSKINELQEELSHNIIEIIKEKLKNDSSTDIDKEVSSTIPSDLTESIYNETKDYVSSLLRIYVDLLPLINMDEKAISFMQECAQRYVVFSDLNFIDEFSKYSFENKMKMRNTCSALRNIFYSHISNRLSSAYAEEQVKYLFDFSEPLSNAYRNIYELYYDKITTNVILAHLNNLIE